MNVLAPAKINLWLSVGPRRGDGYHEIVSVMQSLSLADDLTIDQATQTSIEIHPPDAAPEDDTNLVVRATQALMAATGAASGAAMRLHKRIPVGAGLGGGSADAAAALVGLNELWRAGISRKALEKLGASIGADVPFCVRGGTALARGIGEDLTPLACPNMLSWVIASDGSSLPTAAVYAGFDALGGGAAADPFPLADALSRGDVEAIAASLGNDLTDAALALAPGMGNVRDALLEAGALGVVMTGSGSAWCALARDDEHAREIAGRAGETLAWCEVASSLAHGARIAR